MEHVAAIMMLIGCGQGNIECREISAPAVAFETSEECRELLRPAISEARSRYKVVYGKCEDVDPALFIEDATITWAITPSDELDVKVDFDMPSQPVMMAETADGSRVSHN